MSNANRDRADADAQALYVRYMNDMLDAYESWLDKWYPEEVIPDDQV